LRLADGGSNSTRGHYVHILVLRNISATACTLSGYPGAQYLDIAGRPATTVVHRGSTVFPAVPVVAVPLAAGREASFLISGPTSPTVAGGTCRNSATVAIIAPNTYLPVRAPLIVPVCDPGNVDVSPVVAGNSGPPF
jgi:hypothetical protein